MPNKKLTIFLSLLGLFLPLSYVLAGTVLSSHKYAWSDQVGYINFEHVTVEDSFLSGYAWSANKGFINFSPAEGGVLNDGTGNLSGSAWGEQLGWIDFNNVNISSNGVFFGMATGTLVGTITFDCLNFCDVQTDWRPSSSPVPPPGGGGGGGGGSTIGRSIGILSSVSVAPEGQNNSIILNVPNGTFSASPIAVETTPGFTGARKTGLQASAISALPEKPALPALPALFDIISEPIQAARANPVSFVIFSIIIEILILLLLVFIMRLIIFYFMKKRGRKFNRR